MEQIEKIDKYWRAANYLSLAHIFLKDDVLHERELKVTDLKLHSKGHWGTCPGVNFIIAHLNNYISCSGRNIQLIIGTGHSGNALSANLYMEGSLQKKYKMSKNAKESLNQFLNLEENLYGFRSEISPFYPGTIYDGGELGYSLAVAMGAVLDNEDLTAVVILGDGECETGCISAAWKSIKCLGKKRGHLLPIINLNEYRMGGRSLLSMMDERDITNLYGSMGYDVKYVYGKHEEMIVALNWADEYFEKNIDLNEGRSPLIILKTPKGWTAPSDKLIHIEGNIRAHKNPLKNLDVDDYEFRYFKRWLSNYQPNELFDKNGELLEEIKEILPSEEKKIGEREYQIKTLHLPIIEEIVKNDNNVESNFYAIEEYLKEVIEHNKECFKIVSPDELTSNRLGGLVQYKDNVLEILNEVICQAWMQGYTLSGRTCLMISYEAFMPIISSMVTQFTKYLYQAEKTKWRGPCHSINYLLTSTCWENTYSHQNPEFIGAIIAQENKYAKLYFPIDGNTLLECLNTSLNSMSRINVITVSKGGKAPLLDIEIAKKAINDNCIVGKREEVNQMFVL